MASLTSKPRRALSLVNLFALIASSAGVGGVAQASPFNPPGTGYLDFNYTGVTVAGPTGEKPESKLWWNDGFWWGSLYNNAAGAGAYRIYRLDWGTQTWEDTWEGNSPVALDDREDSKADALWDGAHLYLASHAFTTVGSPTSNTANRGRLYRYSYNTALNSYSLDPGFPVNVNNDQTESLVLDKDSTGRLWVSYVSRPSGGSTDYQVYVNATLTPAVDTSWGAAPFSLGALFPEAHVAQADISSLVAFRDTTGRKIGVLWSNSLSNTVHFATHADSDPNLQTGWTLESMPSITIDDHLSLKALQATASGQVFAAIKTSAPASTDALIGLLGRDTDGAWSFHAYSTKADNDRRPIAMIHEGDPGTTGDDRVYLFVTGKPGGSKVCYKSLPITLPISPTLGDFPPGDCGTAFIEDSTYDLIDSATSTKQNVNDTTGLVILASDELNGQVYVHGVLGNPPPVVTARYPGFNAANVPVTSTVSATFSRPMLASTVTGPANFIVADDSGPASGAFSYADSTRTATFTANPPLRANSAYTVTLTGSIQGQDGQALFGAPEAWNFTTGLPSVLFEATDYSVNEGDGTATITVTLNTPSTQPVTVNYAASDGTASAGSDYTAVTDALTFTPGVTAQTFTVPIIQDLPAVDEPNETVNLTLSNPAGALLGDPVNATLTIVDDDGPLTLQFSQANAQVNEGDGAAALEVTLSGLSVFTVTVSYTTSDNTASANSDYTPITNTLTFPPGVTSRTLTVPVLDDSLDEPDETFGVALSSPSNAILGIPSAAQVAITDNDEPPSMRFNPGAYTVNESTGIATLTAILSAPSGLTVTVDYSTSDGSAVAGLDYVPISGTATFAPGVMSQTFDVTVLDDTLDEANETLTLALSNPGNVTFGVPDAASLTIFDNDASPTVQLSGSVYSVDEGAGQAVITVTLSAPSGQTVSVDYATANSTATAGPLGDYLATDETLTFAPGQTTLTLTVPILNDTLEEPDETFNLILSGPDDAALGSPNTATITILDNDTIHYLYLPLMGRQGLPDLVVQSVSVQNNNLLVVVKNQGAGPVPADSGFWVDLYVDPNPAPTAVNQIWQNLSTRGAVWGVTGPGLPLAPGASIALSLGDGYYWPTLSNISGTLAAGTPLYVQVDSANANTNYGGVLEAHESAGGAYNNILGPFILPSVVTVNAMIPSDSSGGPHTATNWPPRPVQIREAESSER